MFITIILALCPLSIAFTAGIIHHYYTEKKKVDKWKKDNPDSKITWSER